MAWNGSGKGPLPGVLLAPFTKKALPHPARTPRRSGRTPRQYTPPGNPGRKPSQDGLPGHPAKTPARMILAGTPEFFWHFEGSVLVKKSFRESITKIDHFDAFVGFPPFSSSLHREAPPGRSATTLRRTARTPRQDRPKGPSSSQGIRVQGRSGGAPLTMGRTSPRQDTPPGRLAGREGWALSGKS